jgi:[acyl-carrier-protein] S-malonyltransferase
MKKAFIFPGQASQYVGMGKDLYEKYPIARNLFDRANEIMGMDLKKICFEGPEEELKKTNITQPAIYVHSVVVSEILKSFNKNPDGVAGHSLGEYSALTAAGSLCFEDGLRLVKKRGELMYEAGNNKPGTMAAIIGLTPEQVYQLCDRFKSEGILQPANFNSPGQIAISGDVELVRKAIVRAAEMGAMKATELVVSGAFHSPLMAEAQEGLKNALQKTQILNATVPLYSNVEAVAVQDSAKIGDLLFRQLTSPVLWQNLIENMIAEGFNKFYEIGPGKVLKGLLKRINREAKCYEIGTVENIETIGDWV